MAKSKPADTTTFQTLEMEAYHGFIEWPVFLLTKIRHLQVQLNLISTSQLPQPKEKT